MGDYHLRFATIGPAGEKLARFASILNDLTHAAGRTGMGAVMGSKRLKAIAVRGNGGPPLADPDKVRELGTWMAKNWKKYSFALNELGTANLVRGLDASSGLPTRNFREGSLEGAQKISGEVMKETIDDTLPERIHTPFTSGPLAGRAVDRETHRKAMVDLYQMLGWTADGVPTSGKLAELNVTWAGSQD